jgi:hypothetical protein
VENKSATADAVLGQRSIMLSPRRGRRIIAQDSRIVRVSEPCGNPGLATPLNPAPRRGSANLGPLLPEFRHIQTAHHKMSKTRRRVGVLFQQLDLMAVVGQVQPSVKGGWLRVPGLAEIIRSFAAHLHRSCLRTRQTVAVLHDPSAFVGTNSIFEAASDFRGYSEDLRRTQGT